MRNDRFVVRLTFLVVCALMVSSAGAADTDEDGLLDLIDVPGFDPSATGTANFYRLHVEDLDGANLLTHLDSLYLNNNDITSIESGDFAGLSNLRTLALYHNRIAGLQNGDLDGLTHLQSLSLYRNRIARLEGGVFDAMPSLQRLSLAYNEIPSLQTGIFAELTDLTYLALSSNVILHVARGDFDGLSNLEELWLHFNNLRTLDDYAFDGMTDLRTLLLHNNLLKTLNLKGAQFHHLTRCGSITGFCADDKISTLILDDADLSAESFDAIVSETRNVADVSLVGLTFSNENPSDLNLLLGISTLDNVTVDDALFELYADEFNAFAAIDGNTVTVVPEPSSSAILTMSLIALGLRQRRKSRIFQ